MGCNSSNEKRNDIKMNKPNSTNILNNNKVNNSKAQFSDINNISYSNLNINQKGDINRYNDIKQFEYED